MKIENIRIQRFRSFRDETIFFDNYNGLIGPNGAGKSTILTALNIFFLEPDASLKEVNSLEKDDFSFGNTDDPVEITITFSDLSDDESADFSHYVRQGKLIVKAVATFDAATNKAPINRHGIRLGMQEFRAFFEAEKDGANVAELKKIYSALSKKIEALPAPGTKQKMIDDLHEHEAQNEDKCSLIDSSDLFEGFSKGTHKFRKYVQWIYVPAVKDVSLEQFDARNTALSKLLQRVVLSKSDFEAKIEELKSKTLLEYSQILEGHNELLEDISIDLSNRLKNWSSSDASVSLRWHQEDGKSVIVAHPRAGVTAREGTFEGGLNLFGHGLQRSYLLALLQTLAEIDQQNSPLLLLGFEEPELYQHPPQIRYMARTLEELSHGNAQIFFTTHSPLLVSGEGFATVRLVRKKPDDTAEVKQTTHSEINDEEKLLRGADYLTPSGQKARLHQILLPTLSEMFFAKHVTLVEGQEDYAFLATYLKLLDKWDEFHKLGGHIVPASGKDNLLQPMIIATKLGIPIYPVWDTDDKESPTNSALFRFFGRKDLSRIEENMIEDDFCAWKATLAKCVIPEIGEQNWSDAVLKVRTDLQISEKNMSKNVFFLGYVLDELWEKDFTSESLIKLCGNILNHALNFGRE